MKSSSGMTLIEILIVLALIAVLMTFAAPILPTIGRAARVDSTASELAEVLKLAHTEAKRRGLPVYLSSSNEIKTVAAWSAGWFLWVDQNRNGNFNNEPKVIVKQNTYSRMRVTRADRNYDALGFGSSVFVNGFSGNTPISFTVCEGEYAVVVQLSRSGNVAVLDPVNTYGQCPS